MVSAPIIQGRDVTPEILVEVRGLIAGQPDWSRRRLALELCRRWQWHNAAGQIKDMAARSFLDKLEARGWIRLPPRQRRRGPGFAPRLAALPSCPSVEVRESLARLRPLRWQVFNARQPPAARFNAYLARYHYLPYRSTVGENLGYLVEDCQGRDLACVLFGAAAWKTQPRDAFIGWTAAQRQAQLHQVANNSRFLILPWVRVPELASHILGRVARRVAARLAGVLWPSGGAVGDVCGAGPVPGQLLSGGQLDWRGSDARAHPAGSPARPASAGEGCLGLSAASQLSKGTVSMKLFTREELLPLARSQPEALVEIILALQERWCNWSSGSRSWKRNWPATVPTAASRPPATV
jgi:hypothetical protein